LRFGITENRRFSGSCDVIATVRCPFRSLCSLKRINLWIQTLDYIKEWLFIHKKDRYSIW